MLRFYFLLCLLMMAQLLGAQSLFKKVTEKDVSTNGERLIFPERFGVYAVDVFALRAALDQAADAGLPFSVPMPDGSEHRFRMMASTLMAPELATKYPDIRCYEGFGLDHPGERLVCDVTLQGFHAMIRTLGGSDVYIDPYAKGDLQYVMAYQKQDLKPRPDQVFECHVKTDALPGVDPAQITNAPGILDRNFPSDGLRRQYRLAVGCTGEYTAFHGGTKALALSAIVTTVNRINSLVRYEFGVTLQLISATDTLIFLSPSGDPYTNGDTGAMISENQNITNLLLGSGAYDMGHAFGTGGGGLAGLGVVCLNNSKARGVTGLPAPIGDPFDVDYVAHEMGHQFSCNHTQNNDCNRANTSVEPGSGSTIMGYTGICPPNIQNLSDPYYNGINIQEGIQYLTTGTGNLCPIKYPTGNTPPTVNAGPDYTIPRSTPFVLKAEGFDADGDTLTYCWEQMDRMPAPMPPEASNEDGPLFRSFLPRLTPERYFPRFSDLLNNVNYTWEELPGVARELNFRVTVRDNHWQSGNVEYDDMLLTVAGNAGPFVVQSPAAAADIWEIGQYQTVFWDVANTDKAPVSCASVDIRLSTDGGQTFPILLAENVPNTGFACIQTPELPTTQARIMVQSRGNVFFAISNQNFKIQPAAAESFSLCPGSYRDQVCMPETYQLAIDMLKTDGFNAPVQFSATGVPAGAILQFLPNPAQAGTTVIMTIDFPAGAVAEGTYPITVTADAGGAQRSFTVVLTVVSNDYSNFKAVSPADGINGLPQLVTLRWQDVPDANLYELQLALNPAFHPDSLVFTNQNLSNDSLSIPLLLEKNTVYYWRIRPINECGPGPWTDIRAFVTVAAECFVQSASDLPKPISANNAVTVETKINIVPSGVISDVNIVDLSGSHNFFSDLEASLISPQGTSVLLFKSKCANYSGTFQLRLDSESASAFTCPPNATTATKPQNPLTPLYGLNSQGLWTLRIKDNVPSSGGQFSGLSLEFCASVALNPPLLILNNPLFLQTGTNDGISNGLLLAQDTDNTPEELIYTLVTVPQNGLLQLNGSAALTVGAQFTQADINNGGLRFFDFGFNNGPDFFRFALTDNKGNLLVDTFHIEPQTVGTNQVDYMPGYLLAPNPASSYTELVFFKPLEAALRLRLTDALGRTCLEQELAPGLSAQRIDLSTMAAGLYVLSLESPEGYRSKKLIKR